MLLRLVGCEQHRPLLGQWVLASRPGAEKPAEGVDARAGVTPFLMAGPPEFLLHGRRHAPAVGKAELGQHGSRGGQAEVVDEILPQDPHGHGVEQKGALPGESDQASVRVQFQELLVMQILGAHRTPPSH
jgi:hypothetical protein